MMMNQEPDAEGLSAVQFMLDVIDCQFCYRERITICALVRIGNPLPVGVVEIIPGSEQLAPMRPVFVCLECLEDKFKRIEAHLKERNDDLY